MSQLRGLMLNTQSNNDNHDGQPNQKGFEVTGYLFVCFILASILWLAVCYLLYRLIHGCTNESGQLENYDILESDSSDWDEQPERTTYWKRLFGFGKKKVSNPTSTHSLQLVHIAPTPRTKSLPVLVNLDSNSLFVQHKSLN